MRMVPGEDTVLATRDDKRHDYLRKRMVAGYAGKENPTLEPDIDQCVLDLVDLIERKYISTADKLTPMDLARKLQFFTSDIMSNLSFDAKFHDLRDDNDNLSCIHEVETLFPKVFCICTIPRVVDFFTRIGLLKLFGPSTNAPLGMGKVIAITHEEVAKRFDVEGKVTLDKPDMLGSFIRHGLTQEEVQKESVLQLVAGSDTSATAMRSTIFCLMTNPKAYQKLMAEIDAATAAGKIPSGPKDVISDAAAKQMPYLQACIREGLRWYPPIAGLLAKRVPPQGDTINGYFVPGGVSIGYCARGVHHSKELFGPEEYAYRPERWILRKDGGDEASEEKLKAMERHNDFIFGGGKYTCVGKPVAMIEFNKMYVELLRRFEFTVMNMLKPWTTTCYGAHFQRDMWVTVRRRPGRARPGE